MISMNEEKAVKKVLSDLSEKYPDSEIIIVDSSNDQTPNIIKQFKNVKMIRQYPPIGYGPAMHLALKSASKELIITLDCDDTYPIEHVDEFKEINSKLQYDIIDGSRLKNKPKNMKIINYIANYAFALLASILFLKRMTDLHSGMRMYKRDLINELKWNFKGPALPVELLLKPLKKNKKIYFHFINYNERKGESTLDPLPSAWWTLKRIINCRLYAE